MKIFAKWKYLQQHWCLGTQDTTSKCWKHGWIIGPQKLVWRRVHSNGYIFNTIISQQRPTIIDKSIHSIIEPPENERFMSRWIEWVRIKGEWITNWLKLNHIKWIIQMPDDNWIVAQHVRALPAKSLTKSSQNSWLAPATILNFSTGFLCYLSYVLQCLQSGV